MRVSSAVALLLSACAALAAAGPVVISGQVQVNEHLRDLALLGNDAQVHLIRKPSANAPAHPNATAVDLSRLPMHYDTLVRQDGRFIFPDVAPGTYLLSLQARWHAFNMYRVDVNPAPEDAAPVPAHDPKADPQSPAAAAAAAAAAARARRRTASQLVKIRLAPAIAGSIETALMQPPLPVPFTLQPSAKLEFFVEPQPFDLMGMLKSPMVLIAVFGGAMVFLMPKLMVRLLFPISLSLPHLVLI